MPRLLLASFAALFFCSSPALANKFRNAYVSFDLPANWNCDNEGTTWVCVSKDKQPQGKEAAIVLTAKEAAPTDTLAAYAAHLKTKRTTPSPKGPLTSEIKHFGEQNFNGQPWLDSMHLHGELPNHYTRYLATVKDRLGILVTFTAHRKYYTKYSHQFAKAINSLAVVAPKNLLGGQPNIGGQHPGAGETITGPIGQALPDMYQEEYPNEPRSGGGVGTTAQYIGLGLIVLAIALYFLLVRRKKKGSKKKQKKSSPPRPKKK